MQNIHWQYICSYHWKTMFKSSMWASNNGIRPSMANYELLFTSLVVYSECECSYSVTEDCDSSPPPQYVTSGEQSSPPDTPSLTPPAPQNLPQPSSSPWTPPPTPPWSNCGGVNFGPCPSSVCFGCISPLEDKLEPNADSPSRTPPGTPPQLSKKQVSRDILGE